MPPLRFPGFSVEWERVKVSDLLDFFSTNSLSWDMLNYENGKILNLHYGLIHKDLPTIVNMKDANLPFINNDKIPKNYTICESGDVAFADASEDTNDVGKAIEFINIDRDIVCGLHTIHGRDKTDITVDGFKGYLFSSKAYHNQIRRIAQGTKIYSISSKNMDEIYLGIPSKREQEKIFALLYAIDRRIATQNKIIEKLQSLIKGLIQKLTKEGISNSSWHKVILSNILIERCEQNKESYPVHSVSVTAGVINQVEYLGRSFAANDTSRYHVVRYGDIIYTKSPTGNQPYGIVKQSHCQEPVAVSPLYGVYKPLSFEIGNYLHYYFLNPLNTNNYLSPLIQKGAKNTINISNQRFLGNKIPIPVDIKEIRTISNTLSAINQKIQTEKSIHTSLVMQKKFLLQKLFI